MKNKSGKILMTSGAMLIAAALSLASYNIYSDKSAGNYSEKVLKSIEAEIPQLQTEYSNLNSDRIIEERKIESIKIENNDYIGIIHIPSLNLKLPVMSEFSYENLKLSPCRYKGDINDNSIIIAAHNYSSHFGNIKDLTQGDKVYFIDVNGIVYSYKVSETQTLGGNETDKMESGDWALTLFTCNFDGGKRLTVRCVKADN